MQNCERQSLVQKFIARSIVFAALAGGFLTFSLPANGQPLKIYRGSIGGSHVEMRLNFEGNKISGTYAYDRVGENLKLSGQVNAQGGVELGEFDAKRKQTGRITCKRKLDDSNDSECTWSRVDGTHQAYVSLEEQYVEFTNGFQIVPKTIIDRPTGISVSYPQLTRSGGALSATAENFNRRVTSLVQKAIKDFEPKPIGRISFDTNYNVMLATNDLISVEMSEYSDSGGAHPNDSFWTITFDLSRNKELKIEDVFKKDSEYRTAIAKYVVTDIDRRAVAIEQEEARREGRKAEPRVGLVSMDDLSELSGWTLTPKGIMVYFDFAHVMAVFDRTFVPYTALKEYLRPDGPAARFN